MLRQERAYVLCHYLEQLLNVSYSEATLDKADAITD